MWLRWGKYANLEELVDVISNNDSTFDYHWENVVKYYLNPVLKSVFKV